MSKKLSEISEILNKSVLTDDFIDICYEIVDELDNLPNPFEAVEVILRLMEDNPDAEFGTPGPLVHFIEKFYKKGYEEKLVESLERCPTKHTVWMLNRIINGSEGDKKDNYVAILKNITQVPGIEESVLSLAKHFVSLHI